MFFIGNLSGDSGMNFVGCPLCASAMLEVDRSYRAN